MVAVGQQVESLIAAHRAANDHIREGGKWQALVLFDQTRNFRGDGGVGLAVEHARGIPIDKADQRERREGKDRQIDSDDTECLGA